MNSKLITGRYLTKYTNRLFKIIYKILHFIELVVVLPFRLLNKLLVRLTRKVDAWISRMAKRNIAKKTTVNNNTILFTTVQGEYTCNPKYIAEEILRRKLPYDIVWVLRGPSLGPYPTEFKFVKDRSLEYFKVAAKSKVIVQNGHSLQKNEVAKNANQYWLQTWHGSLGLKRLEGAGGDEKFYKKMQRLDAQQTDYLLSNSQFEDDVYSGTYWPKVPILRVGHARNDILFDNSKKTASTMRTKVLKRLNIPDTGQKFLLFAPTHDDKNPDQSFGNIDFDGLRDTLGSKFGGTWEILIRTHNNNKKQSDKWLSGLPLFCHNASFYPDMQELLILADVGLTDYSSWICDYILTRKPSFLYGTNVKKYSETRGFYHKMEDTPFSMAATNSELMKNISKFDQNKYEKRIETFLKSCVCVDDGMASKRIVDKIEELMSN